MHRFLSFGAPEYTLTRRQWVPRPIEEVFPFFDNPDNLPLITPPWLGFQVTSMDPPIIGPGTIISYRLRWFGIPYRWRTLIAEWVPNKRFVDTQLHGPYILWRHTHVFEPDRGGTWLKDRVRYRLPFGVLGVALHALIVRRQLDEIFDYRVQRIAALLADGKVHGSAPATHSGEI
jgi:ligand-binding SRPBCC domain-containing protein